MTEAIRLTGRHVPVPRTDLPALRSASPVQDPRQTTLTTVAGRPRGASSLASVLRSHQQVRPNPRVRPNRHRSHTTSLRDPVR